MNYSFKHRRKEQRAARIASEFEFALRHGKEPSKYLASVTADAERIHAAHVDHLTKIRGERAGKISLAYSGEGGI